MNSFMIDIETMSTNPEAAVISIGICAFNLEQKVVASDGWAIRSSDWHGEILPDTIKWWSQQNEAAREYSFYGHNTSLQAAVQLKQFFEQHRGAGAIEECWANDPDFDLVILKRWWLRTEQIHKHTLGPFPIGFRASRSCRTMFDEAKRLGIDYNGAYGHATVAHNPIDDACNQARAVIQIRNNLIGATA
jgi:hypothetical protein